MARKAGDWLIQAAEGGGYVVVHPTFGPLAHFAECRDALAYAYRTQAADRADACLAS